MTEFNNEVFTAAAQVSTAALQMIDALTVGRFGVVELDLGNAKLVLKTTRKRTPRTTTKKVAKTTKKVAKKTVKKVAKKTTTRRSNIKK